MKAPLLPPKACYLHLELCVPVLHAALPFGVVLKDGRSCWSSVFLLVPWIHGLGFMHEHNEMWLSAGSSGFNIAVLHRGVLARTCARVIIEDRT